MYDIYNRDFNNNLAKIDFPNTDNTSDSKNCLLIAPTGRVGKATNVAVFSFAGIVLIYWFNCRISLSRSRFTIAQTERSLKNTNDITGRLSADHSNDGNNQTKD